MLHLFSILHALAQDPDASKLGKELNNPYVIPIAPVATVHTVGEYVTFIINIVLYLAGALAVIYILYGGITYITAGGDEAKATKARTAIVNAVIGIIIILLAFVIEKLASSLLAG